MRVRRSAVVTVVALDLTNLNHLENGEAFADGCGGWWMQAKRLDKSVSPSSKERNCPWKARYNTHAKGFGQKVAQRALRLAHCAC
jgi:hypothetical protein